MAAPASPSLAVAEPAAIRHRARQMRLAARQTLGRAVQAQAQATMQSAARVRSSPPAQGSLLAQLLQPLLAPADASRAAVEPAQAAVRPRSTPAIGAELEGSLATIRSQVQAIHRQFQLARHGTVVTRTGHLRLVPPPESTPTSRTPQRPRRALRRE
jgi:hypothetical protein